MTPDAVSLKESSKSNILLIYMGGTIGMIEDPDTGTLRAFDFTHLQQHVDELQHLDCSISSIQFEPPIDSSNVSVDLWLELAGTIADNYDKFDGFVVLHGTDTMAYTASAISFLLEGLNKPVIFTGSQLPIGKIRTDGKENLITALQIAAEKNEAGEPMVPEVCIFFNSNLLRANRTVKSSADQFSAFHSYNYPPLGHAGIDIVYNKRNIHRYKAEDNVVFTPLTRMEQHVSVLKIFPGITPSVVTNILSQPDLKGIVIETYGSGNAPTFDWFVEAIKAAVSRGVVVVNVTQCNSGSVEMQRYETGMKLSEIGVVSGKDMTTECALAKLMYLLAKPLTLDEVKRLMATSLCGEMTTKDSFS